MCWRNTRPETPTPHSKEITMTIVITGTSRGLGLEFVRQYLESGRRVIATCRTPGAAGELQALRTRFAAALTVLQLDVTDGEARARVHDEVKELAGRANLLINNAGVQSGDEGGSYTFGRLHEEDMGLVFRVNAISPLLMVEAFVDLLALGREPKVVNITSWLGSISDKSQVFGYSYCASKATLNMFSKQLSIELRDRGIAVLALHPGHVQTDMGGAHAPLVPEQSVRGMIRVIDGLTLQGSGRFLDWQGNEIPW
jgi:NAD(P)-dependent dehydrogenase (short-subunit alcohol dehydrogenase family)